MIYPVTIKRKNQHGELEVQERLTAEQASSLFWNKFQKENGVQVSLYGSTPLESTLRKKSKYKNVYHYPGLKKPWQGQVHRNGTNISLGYFKAEQQAAQAAATYLGCPLKELLK